MMFRVRYHFVLVSFLMIVLVLGPPWASSYASGGPREIMWEDLMPKDWRPFDPYTDLSEEQLKQLYEGSPLEQKLMREYMETKSSAPVVTELNGKQIRIPGYIVPLDFAGTELSEFLLVPYFGACIHVPPPPANQIVYVKLKNPFNAEGMFVPVWVTGTLTTEAHLNLVGDAGYTLEADNVELYKSTSQ